MKTEEILESITGGFFALDKNFTITYWNKSAEEGTGFLRNDVIGKNIFEIFPNAKDAEIGKRYKLAMEKKKTQFFTSLYEDEKHEAWYSIKIYPNKEGLSVFFQDVTDEKRSQIQEVILLELNRHINSTFKIEVLANKTIELISQYLKVPTNEIKIFGCDENEIFLIEPQFDNEKISNHLNKIQISNSKLVIAEAITTSSIIASSDLTRAAIYEVAPNLVLSSRLKNVVAIPLKISKDIIGCIEVLPFGTKEKIEREISFLTMIANEFAVGINRLQLNDEIKIKNLDLELKQEQLKTAHETLKKFLAFFSHELRSPLTSILGFSDLILTEKDLELETARNYSSRIFDSGKHLLTLINDILDLSKLEAGKLDLQFTQILVKQFFENLIETFKPQTSTKNQTIIFKSSDEIDLMIADEVRLKQIFTNLISNAIKFSFDNSTIFIHAKRESNNLIFKVKDSGVGIHKSDLQKLFSPFFQTQNAKKQNIGTGLGLSLSKKLIELHGGEISVISEIGKGSEFIVTIPMMVQAIDEVAETVNALKSTIARAPKEIKILVVEDKEHPQMLLKKTFSDVGYIVEIASSGVEALEMAKIWKPDVITLDILLPLKDGWQVMRELKSHPICKNIPIIIISMVDERKLGFGLGAAEYFVKPIQKDILLEAVKKVATKFSLEQKTTRILVIDDDSSSIELIKIILEAEGCTVLQANNGIDGLKIASQERPDLIILDLVMPGMSGFDVAYELKHKGATVNIPIIVMTGMEIDNETREQLEGFVVSLMKKSGFTKKDLLNEISSLNI